MEARCNICRARAVVSVELHPEKDGDPVVRWGACANIEHIRELVKREPPPNGAGPSETRITLRERDGQR